MENVETKTVAIEPSTNTHELSGVKEVKQLADCTVCTVAPEEAILSHGEHGTLKIENENVVFYRQQEYNPVSKAYQNVVD